GKMPGEYLVNVMCSKQHPLLKDKHADGDGHWAPLILKGFSFIKSFDTWSYDRYEDGEVYLKRDPNGTILKVKDYASLDEATGAWWTMMSDPKVFSGKVRTVNVTVFDGANFEGSYKENGPHFRTGVNYERAIADGEYTKDDLWSFYGIADNTISSLRIPKGWQVTVFDGDQFDGSSAVYTSDAANLDALDNKISSIKIKPND
ncbi:hypothetical protein K8I31_09495, partial [bacterium]|nr:hypothetical protein [bacterium]